MLSVCWMLKFLGYFKGQQKTLSSLHTVFNRILYKLMKEFVKPSYGGSMLLLSFNRNQHCRNLKHCIFVLALYALEVDYQKNHVYVSIFI